MVDKITTPNLLIAASSHRSGSTWLQRIIHAATNVFIWGESFPLVELLSYTYYDFKYHDKVRNQETKQFFYKDQSPTAWVANINPPLNALRNGMIALFSKYYVTHGREKYGWKEVRYGRNELEFLWELFPQLRVILLVRNPKDVVRSLRGLGWIGQYKETQTVEIVCKDWSRRTSDYLALIEREDVFFIHYEDVISQLKDLLTFVGGDTNEEVTQAVNTVVGNTPKLSDLQPEDEDTILKFCAREMEILGYVDETLGSQSFNWKKISKQFTLENTPYRPLIQDTISQVIETYPAVRVLQNQIWENEQKINLFSGELAFSNEKLQLLITQLAEKEQAAQTLSTQLTEKGQVVQTLSTQLTEKEQVVQTLSTQLTEKEQVVQALSTQLTEKEQVVQALSTQLTEKEQVVQALSTQLTEKEQVVKVLKMQENEKEQIIQALTTQVQDKENLQNAFWNVSTELEKVYNSNFWKLASFYYTAMKTAPLKYPYRFIKIWREQGLSKSLNKAYIAIRGIKQDSYNKVSFSPPDRVDDSTQFLKSIIDDLSARPLKGLFFVTSAFSFDELYNQRVINLSKFLAEKNYGVVYVAWRWSKTEDTLKVGKEVYQNIIQIPVDMFLEADVQLEKVMFSKIFFIIQFPHPDFFLKMLQLKRHNLVVVYEIIDDWEEFYKVDQAPWYNKAFEESIIINSDVITAVSPPLVEKFSKVRNNINLLPNGFTPKLLGKNHSNIARRNFHGPEVNIGYFGHLTASWFDWDLIFETLELSASHDNQLMFHLIGYGEPNNIHQELIKHGNRVRFYGKVHPVELHKYVRDWDLGIIPFKSGKLSESVDPIKIYEYMYFGLPVIVSGIKHLSKLPSVHFVSNANQIIDVTNNYKKDIYSYEYNLLAEQLPALTWEQRFADFLDILERNEKWISF